LSENGAAFIAGTVVVLLALVSPVAYVIVNRIIVRTWATIEFILHERYSRRRQARELGHPGHAEDNEQDLLLRRPPRRSYYKSIRETWKYSKTPDAAVFELGGLAWKIVTHASEDWAEPAPRGEDADAEAQQQPLEEVYTGFTLSNLRPRKWELVLLVFLLLFCLLLFGLFIWGSIAAANIISDPIALSDSPDCGYWIPDPSVKPKENGTYGFFYLQELDAGRYAKDCYGKPRGTDGCNSFVSQDIPYSITEHDICPFSDELCLEGRYSAFTMSTPLISSKALGINVPTGYLFNRTTTCAPISRDGYVLDAGDSYEYNYGPIPGVGNLTWTASKDDLKTFPGYEVA